MIEIIVVLAIAGILALMAAPSFRDSLRRNGMDSAMLEVMSAVGLARSEAVNQGRLISICRSTNLTACDATAGADWNAGWIIFTDSVTPYGAVSTGDTLLQVHGPGNDQAKITLKTATNTNFTGNYLQFDDDGFLNNSTTGAYFKFCDQSNVVANARAVLLGNTGRPAMSMDDSDAGDVHDVLDGSNLTCP